MKSDYAIFSTRETSETRNPCEEIGVMCFNFIPDHKKVQKSTNMVV